LQRGVRSGWAKRCQAVVEISAIGAAATVAHVN
jgi:hypothetical protein